MNLGFNIQTYQRFIKNNERFSVYVLFSLPCTESEEGATILAELMCTLCVIQRAVDPKGHCLPIVKVGCNW